MSKTEKKRGENMKPILCSTCKRKIGEIEEDAVIFGSDEDAFLGLDKIEDYEFTCGECWRKFCSDKHK